MGNEGSLKLGVDVNDAIRRLEELRSAFDKLSSVGKAPESLSESYNQLNNRLKELQGSLSNNLEALGAWGEVIAGDEKDFKSWGTELVKGTASLERLTKGIE